VLPVLLQCIVGLFREWESECFCFSALDSAIDTTLKMADSLISSLTTELENWLRRTQREREKTEDRAQLGHNKQFQLCSLHWDWNHDAESFVLVTGINYILNIKKEKNITLECWQVSI